MEALKWVGDPPELRSPVLVAAFAGWNDAASAATTALEAIAVSLEAEPVAEIDPEEFYDFQVTRPTIRMAEGEARQVDWPENTIFAAVAPAAERDLVLVSGVEPNLRWRTFAEAVIEAAERLGVEMVVTLGALLADVPHTRAGPDHRARLRPRAGRAPHPEPLELRGPDRDRRHRPRRLPPPRADLGQPLGGRPPLRRRGPEPEGGAGAAAPARGLHRDRDRGLGARGGDGAVRDPGRPRGRRQPRDRGARPPARVRAGR